MTFLSQFIRVYRKFPKKSRFFDPFMTVDNLYSRVYALYTEAQGALKTANTKEELDFFESHFLSKKTGIPSLLKEIKNLSPEEKKKSGGKIHAMSKEIMDLFQIKKQAQEKQWLDEKLKQDWIDVTKSFGLEKGSIHPLNHVQRRVEKIFTGLGFDIADGPEIETEWHNFDALNIPDSHPARDMQDTFWVTSGLEDSLKNAVLRTQTSNVQIRTMKNEGVPIRLIAPGRVYRNEEVDITHDSTFYQVEGLLVDKNISLAHLKGVIQTMLDQLFEKEIKIRFRPGYFPFVEPGLEVDIWFEFTDKNGHKRSQWMEFMGAGMVHPNVLRNCDVNPDEYSGFAFGFGLTRLVMITYGIEDIRLLFSQKKDFLQQF